MKHPGDKAASALGGTVAHEFERILAAGPNSIRSSLKRAVLVAEQALQELAPDLMRVELRYHFSGPVLDWTLDQDVATKGNVLALIHLRGLCQSPPEMPDLAARIAVFQELARLYFLALLVPMLRSDGVSRKQARTARHTRKDVAGGGDTTDDQQAHARTLRSRKKARADAVKDFAEHYGVSLERARAVFRAIGWHRE